MDIVYACDDKYAMLAGVSIESLYASNRDIDELNVYILTNHLSVENEDKLCEISGVYRRNITFVEAHMSELCRTIHMNTTFWSIDILIRFFAPQLLPNLHRILYLDCDTIVTGSLKGLSMIDLANCSCAAVSEPMNTLHKRDLNMLSSDNYYNSGVMVIDLDMWREKKATEDFLSCLERHKGRLSYPDQDVINEVLRGHIISLPMNYNVNTLYCDFSYEEAEIYRAGRNEYFKTEVEAAKENPIIIHYNGSFLTPRPWVEGSTHPYAAQWESYCARTPWRDAKKWSDQPGTSKLALRWIFHHTPRPVGIRIARLVNSVVRPLLKQ